MAITLLLGHHPSMNATFLFIALLSLAACGEKEPARPDDADQQRFEDIEGMLDEAGKDVPPEKEKGAASQDTAPSD